MIQYYDNGNFKWMGKSQGSSKNINIAVLQRARTFIARLK